MSKEYLDNEISKINLALNNYKKTLICILSKDKFEIDDFNIIHEIIVRLNYRKEFLTELYADI